MNDKNTLRYYLVLITEENNGYEYTLYRLFTATSKDDLDEQLHDALMDWYGGDMCCYDQDTGRYQYYDSNICTITRVQEIPETDYRVLNKYI